MGAPKNLCIYCMIAAISSPSAMSFENAIDATKYICHREKRPIWCDESAVFLDGVSIKPTLIELGNMIYNIQEEYKLNKHVKYFKIEKVFNEQLTEAHLNFIFVYNAIAEMINHPEKSIHQALKDVAGNVWTSLYTRSGRVRHEIEILHARGKQLLDPKIYLEGIDAKGLARKILGESSQKVARDIPQDEEAFATLQES